MAVIELREVGVSHGARSVLAGVSLTLASGEHTAVIGRSGSGKSTLLRVIAGLETPDAGEVVLDGETASRAGAIVIPPHRRGVSMVFQDLALWPNLTALGNVVLGLAGARLPRREARERARRALTLCGIEALAARRPGELSGGEQQRVALARALAARPAFLLLDEPFAGLDLETRHGIVEEIVALAGETGATLVVVTHDPLEARRLCRRAAVLESGRVEESGTFDELLRSPRSGLMRLFARLGAGGGVADGAE